MSRQVETFFVECHIHYVRPQIIAVIALIDGHSAFIQENEARTASSNQNYCLIFSISAILHPESCGGRLHPLVGWPTEGTWTCQPRFADRGTTYFWLLYNIRFSTQLRWVREAIEQNYNLTILMVKLMKI